MLIEIVWNGETTAVDLMDGTVRVGGSPSDEIHLAGLAPSLLTLQVAGEKVTLKARTTIRVGAALFPAHVARLVVEAEEVRLPNNIVIRRPIDAKRVAARRGADTAFIARELMGGLVAPQQTRAATLTCVTGHDVGTAYALAFAESLVGRGTDVDVRLHDRSVSRHHARLVRRGRDFLVEDLGTTNGVYVNGVRAKGFKALATGDIVELGQTMLRYDGPERAPQEETVAQRRRRPTEAVTEKQLPATAVGARRASARRLPPTTAEISVELEGDASTQTERLPWKQPRREAPSGTPGRRARGLLTAETLLISAGIALAMLGMSVTMAMLR